MLTKNQFKRRDESRCPWVVILFAFLAIVLNIACYGGILCAIVWLVKSLCHA